jgi:type IV pilus assembly protein PilO
MRFGLREALFILVLLGLPVAAYFFVFLPNNAQIEQAKRENTIKRQKLQQLKVNQHIADLGTEIENLSEEIAEFEAKLPSEKEVDVILREVWQLATQRGLKSRSVRTEKLVKSQRYSELPIKMEMFGDFDGFYAFLLDLERLSRITRVHEMQLEKLKELEGHIEAKFTLSIFFEPQSSKPTSAPGA